MASGRYVVANHAGPVVWVLIDPSGRICYESTDKAEVIRQSQLRNHYEPADGREETYSRQLTKRGLDDDD